MLHLLRRKAAFTLIELLIVVAIIAILAAIAVPNFLEAQTRSKVSRAKADMRSLVTAIESYFVDHNKYPWPADAFGQVLITPTEPWFETKYGSNITTPISYLTTRFADPFHPKASASEDPIYHLLTAAYCTAETGSRNEFDSYVNFFTGSPTVTRYVLLSHGPDLDHDSPDIADNPDGLALYDPTNGTISNGDLLYFGPGTGFRN